MLSPDVDFQEATEFHDNFTSRDHPRHSLPWMKQYTVERWYFRDQVPRRLIPFFSIDLDSSQRLRGSRTIPPEKRRWPTQCHKEWWQWCAGNQPKWCVFLCPAVPAAPEVCPGRAIRSRAIWWCDCYLLAMELLCSMAPSGLVGVPVMGVPHRGSYCEQCQRFNSQGLFAMDLVIPLLPGTLQRISHRTDRTEKLLMLSEQTRSDLVFLTIWLLRFLSPDYLLSPSRLWRPCENGLTEGRNRPLVTGGYGLLTMLKRRDVMYLRGWGPRVSFLSGMLLDHHQDCLFQSICFIITVILYCGQNTTDYYHRLQTIASHHKPPTLQSTHPPQLPPVAKTDDTCFNHKHQASITKHLTKPIHININLAKHHFGYVKPRWSIINDQPLTSSQATPPKPTTPDLHQTYTTSSSSSFTNSTQAT